MTHDLDHHRSTAASPVRPPRFRGPRSVERGSTRAGVLPVGPGPRGERHLGRVLPRSLGPPRFWALDRRSARRGAVRWHRRARAHAIHRALYAGRGNRLAYDHWGHGYATEAARAGCEFGLRVVGLDEIVAFTVPSNTRSRHVMTRLGMTHSADDDFDHPLLAVEHPLCRHVLYRLPRHAPTRDAHESRTRRRPAVL
jgi:hypothetical protein